jgi:hypothetical protein
MLNDRFHPEKIAEGNQRVIIEIMKQGYVFTPVNDLLLRVAAYILQLVDDIVQVFFITVFAGIDPYIPEKNGSALDI